MIDLEDERLAVLEFLKGKGLAPKDIAG